MNPALAFSQVSKAYPLTGGSGSRYALREVCFSVAAGQKIAIVGRSGSGKSTLLHLAAGIDVPSTGEVWVDGRELGRLSEGERTLFRRHEVGLIFQFFHLLSHLSVGDNVALPAMIAGENDAASQQRVMELLLSLADDELDDGRELMLYLLRDEDGAVDHARGTLIEAGGAARYLERGEFAVAATDHWTSPQTGAQYPAGWTLSLGNETWTLEALLADQENRGAATGKLFYWEGAVAVRDQAGNQCGKGYVELTGYGTGMRPGI